MPNITISIEEKLLKSGRKYAAKNNLSLNMLIRKLLEDTVYTQSKDWLKECFELMDRVGASSQGKKWKREDLYNV